MLISRNAYGILAPFNVFLIFQFVQNAFDFEVRMHLTSKK